MELALAALWKRQRVLRPTARRAWGILACQLADFADAEAVAAARAAWWDQALLKRAPVLSTAPGVPRVPVCYGAASQYGLTLAQPLSAAAFYHYFRFAREDIPRLRAALRIPLEFHTSQRDHIDGEEGLLLFLRRMAYPGTLLSLERFFGRSSGPISRIFEVVRQHLEPVALKMTATFDAQRLVPLLPTFATAVIARCFSLSNASFSFSISAVRFESSSIRRDSWAPEPPWPSSPPVRSQGFAARSAF